MPRPRRRKFVRTSYHDRPESQLLSSGLSGLARVRDGVVVPILGGLLGLYMILTAHHPSRRGGSPNVPLGQATGIVCMAIALIWHIHQFWYDEPALAPHAGRAKVATILISLVALGWVFM